MIALTCKIGAAESWRLGGTIVTVFLFFVVCCVLLCVQEAVGSLACPPLAHKYDILHYGIALGT